MTDSGENEEIKFGDSPETAFEWVNNRLESTEDKIVLAKGWCKRCGICISICPVKALDRNPKGYPYVDNEKCISCGSCELTCPDFAIVVTDFKARKKKAG